MPEEPKESWKDKELFRGAIIRHCRFFLMVEPTPDFVKVLLGDADTLFHQAISTALAQRDKELREKILSTYGKDGGPALVTIESTESGVSQRPALSDILSLLNKQ